MNTKKVKRSEAITRIQDEIACYLNSDNDCTSQPLLFDLHYRNLYSSEALQSKGAPVPTPPTCKTQLETIIADMKLCNNPHDRYLITLYPSRFEMGNPLQIKKATPEKLRKYLVGYYGKASASPESFNLSDQTDKVLTLFADSFALMLKEDLKRENSQYKGSIYKLVVLNHKLGLINQKWADLVKPQAILLEGKSLPSTIDNQLSFNVTNKKKSVENSAIIETYLTEISSPTPGNTIQRSEFLKMLPVALQILEDDINLRTITSFSAISNKSESINSWLELYQRRLDKTTQKRYDNAHHEVLDHLSTQAQYNLHRNRFIGQYKLLKDLEINKLFEKVILELLSQENAIRKTESLTNAKDEKLANIIAKIFSDSGAAAMSNEGINVARFCARAIVKLGSVKISGYTQGHTSPAYSLRAMLNHIANHYDQSEKKSPAERLGSVPPSTFYLLILLRDAVYWGFSNVVNSTNEYFTLQKEIIKNSLKLTEFLREYNFHNVLVLASNIWLDEEQGLRCHCGNDNCICGLTKLFYSYHGGFLNMLSEHSNRASNSPANDPLPKYEELYRQLEDKE